jgi:hypothetical protein
VTKHWAEHTSIITGEEKKHFGLQNVQTDPRDTNTAVQHTPTALSTGIKEKDLTFTENSIYRQG